MREFDESDGMAEEPRDYRLPFGGLTSMEIDAIADRAATKALERVYAEVGKSVVRKFMWIVGIVVVSLLIWLAGKNALHVPQ